MENIELNKQEAEKIKQKYLTKEERRTKLDQLKSLDKKVTQPGIITSAVLGTIGTLLFGAGMSCMLEWSNLTLCLSLGIPGLLLALSAYPIYRAITNKRKQKYSEKITKLSDEIIAE